ncbi:MAG: glycosyltransferase family 4 protein [Bacillota bacterium]
MKEKIMKILHLNSNYDQSSIYPTMFKSINEIPNVSGRLYYPVRKIGESKSLHIDGLDISKCLNQFDRYFYSYRNKKLFRDVQKNYELKSYDFLLAYSLFSNGYLAYTLNKKFNIPYVVIVQNTDVNMYFKKMFHLREIGKKILRNAFKIIFISESYREHVLKKYIPQNYVGYIRGKSVVIPFGIDEFWFENLNKPKTNLKDSEIKLLYVGKVNSNKNLTTTIKVCNFLISKGYNVSYTIVGDIEEDRIGKQVREQSFINYLPFMSKESLLQIYRENDIFIMPSKKESFGLVYAEAMTQGLPVIYTRGQGFDNHFNNGKIGYSVDCYDVKYIANCIISIKENYMCLSENCIDLVSRFNWVDITNEHARIFNEVID